MENYKFFLLTDSYKKEYETDKYGHVYKYVYKY